MRRYRPSVRKRPRPLRIHKRKREKIAKTRAKNSGSNKNGSNLTQPANHVPVGFRQRTRWHQSIQKHISDRK